MLFCTFQLEPVNSTTGQTAVNTLIPNVVNRDNLVPFITGVVNSQPGNNWDDATHTAEITDGGGWYFLSYCSQRW